METKYCFDPDNCKCPEDDGVTKEEFVEDKDSFKTEDEFSMILALARNGFLKKYSKKIFNSVGETEKYHELKPATSIVKECEFNSYMNLFTDTFAENSASSSQVTESDNGFASDSSIYQSDMDYFLDGGLLSRAIPKKPEIPVKNSHEPRKESEVNLRSPVQSPNNPAEDQIRLNYNNDAKRKQLSNSKFAKEVNHYLNSQKEMIQEICSKSLDIEAVSAHIAGNFRFLAKRASSFNLNAFVLTSSFKLLLINTVKMYEMKTMRGCQNTAPLLGNNFIKIILLKYMASPREMTTRSRKWIFARELLRLCIDVITNHDILMALQGLIVEMQISFIERWSTGKNVPSERNFDFITYVLEQLNNLVSYGTARMVQIKKKKLYS